MLNGEGFTVAIGPTGGLELTVGADSYMIGSSFSYPGGQIGWNRLGAGDGPGEHAWKPAVNRKGDTRAEVVAQGRYYAIKRTVTRDGERVVLEDTLTSASPSAVGVVIEHAVTAKGKLDGVLLGGASVASATATAENPSAFMSQPGSSLGVLAEDNVFRLQLELTSSANQVQLAARHFALKAGTSYTFRWSLYPSARRGGYFDFINSVRRDWKTNFTVLGPFDFLDSRDSLLSDPTRLKAHLRRKKLRIVALRPWLSYFDGAGLARDEHKAMLQNAMRALKNADPEVRCVGCVEKNIVSLDSAKVSQSDRFNDVCIESGKYPIALSDEQTAILDEVSPWKDSLIRDRDGRAMIEDCFPKTFIHQIVYSEPGNYHANYLLEQTKFLIDEVGLDGVYIDQFSHAWGSSLFQYHYGKWDGFTADVNPNTGQIDRKYTDAGLVGAKVREALCQHVVSKGKVFVANTHAAVAQTQPLPVFRFMEAGWSSKGAAWKRGEEPPLLPYLCKGHLDSPIGLGIVTSQFTAADNARRAEILMRAVITYLRHAILYYHYGTNISETGPGSGEYGPINHMFPITPIELGKGFIIGKERIITAVSLDRRWDKPGEPVVRFFDMTGRETDGSGRYDIRTRNGERRVILQLKDWAEIAVVE